MGAAASIGPSGPVVTRTAVVGADCDITRAVFLGQLLGKYKVFSGNLSGPGPPPLYPVLRGPCRCPILINREDELIFGLVSKMGSLS